MTEVCLWTVLLGGAVAGMVFLLLRKPRWIAAGLLVTAAVLAFSRALTPPGYLRGFLGGLVLWGSTGGLVWLLRRNVIGYLAAAGVAMFIPALTSFAHHPALRADAVEIGAVGVAALIAVLIWTRRESARSAPATGPV